MFSSSDLGAWFGDVDTGYLPVIGRKPLWRFICFSLHDGISYYSIFTTACSKHVFFSVYLMFIRLYQFARKCTQSCD